MKWVIRKSDKRIMCSTDKPESCLPHVLIVYGGSLTDYEEREGDNAGYEAAKLEDPVEAAQKAKAQAIIDNLPSLAAVNTAINNAFPNTAQRNFLKKLVLPIYQHLTDKLE